MSVVSRGAWTEEGWIGKLLRCLTWGLFLKQASIKSSEVFFGGNLYYRAHQIYNTRPRVSMAVNDGASVLRQDSEN